MNKHTKPFVWAISALLLLSLGGCATSPASTAASQPAASASDGYFILRGDLHCHSNFSRDSEVPAETVIKESIETGYDFIALTEHNTMAQLLQDLSTDQLIVLPGYELTLETGHINLFGLRSFDERVDMLFADEISAFMTEFRAQGGYSQVNHPNDPKYAAKFGYNVDMDFIEVWNNAKFGSDDQQTVSDWHDMLCLGRKIVATTGTDEHKKHLNRSPFNNVYVKERSSEAILSSIKAGHTFITKATTGPKIQLHGVTAIMGDTVSRAAEKTVTLSISDLEPNSSIRIFSDAGKEFEETPSTSTNYEKKLDTQGRKFYRVEVWNSDGEMRALSNPIFIEA